MDLKNFLSVSDKPLDGTLPSVSILKGIQGFHRQTYLHEGAKLSIDIILYAAKVVGSTLSPHDNGIAIILPESNSIIATELFREATGRNGASLAQVDAFKALISHETYLEFSTAVNRIAKEQNQLRESLTYGLLESCA